MEGSATVLQDVPRGPYAACGLRTPYRMIEDLPMLAVEIMVAERSPRGALYTHPEAPRNLTLYAMLFLIVSFRHHGSIIIPHTQNAVEGPSDSQRNKRSFCNRSDSRRA